MEEAYLYTKRVTLYLSHCWRIRSIIALTKFFYTLSSNLALKTLLRDSYDKVLSLINYCL